MTLANVSASSTRPRPRLGELLVQRGWITGEQLIRAIQSQRAQGGRIGTCLLELDALSEDRLLDALAQQLGAPSVDVDQLEQIDEDVLSLVPQDLAARCRAVPVEADHDELRVAALNADDLSLLKLLSPDTGRRVQPLVANEVRILEALRRYYGIEVPGRYKPLIVRLNDQRSRRATAVRKSGLRDDGGLVDIQWKRPDRVLNDGLASGPTSSNAPEEATPHAARTTLSSAPGARSSPAAATPTSLDGLAHQLAGLQDTQAIGAALFAFLGQRFSRRAFLKIHGRRAHGWMASSDGLDTQRFSELEIDLDAPSVFAEMADGFPLHRGPIEATAAHTTLARCWGLKALAPCVVLPIWVRDRLIAVLYGDRGEAGLGDLDLEEIEGVGTKAGLAFEICILHRKLLRGMSRPLAD